MPPRSRWFTHTRPKGAAGFAKHTALALVASASLGFGCAAGADRAVVRHPEGASAAVVMVPPVSDAEFAGKVHDLLLMAPKDAARARLLASVLGRQMARAVGHFRAHEAGRGLIAVIGGLYLLHTGDLSAETLGPEGREALREAVRELAVRGDDGRAHAVYDILLRLGPDDIKAEVQGHLDAIASWTRDELKAGPPTIATGAVETASVARSLLEPTEAAKKDALGATLDWVAAAVDLRNRAMERKAHPTPEERGEAVRALQTGDEVLAEIFLRDADGPGASAALAKSPLRQLDEPHDPEGRHDRGTELRHAIDALGGSPTATAWLDVLHVLTARERGQEDDDVMEDRELVRAATFGIALEAYRLDPTDPEAAALVAAVLQDFGFAEATPAIIAEATRAHADARTVSGALSIVVRAMSIELSSNDVDAVRRTYAAAAPVLAVAEQKEIAARASPNAARVRAMMGEIELEQGALDAARALLSASAAEEKSGNVLLALARIDRHDDKLTEALADLRAAKDASDTTGDPALRGEVLLMTSDISRDLGDASESKQALVDALKTLEPARTLGGPEQRARVELVLARVLDRFGAREKAQQALERAFEATPHDKRQIAATLGQIVARAFVRKDLLAAHDGLTRAVASELGDDELVYYALWVHLLERQLKKTGGHAPDSTAARVFASIPDDGHWIGKLAAFGAGRLPASQLAALAKTKAEKTEAAFYEVMDARASNVGDPNNAGLRAVLRGDGVDLMEAVIARELLREASGVGPVALPQGVKLP